MYQSQWKFRPPPENTGTFQICKNPQACLFGNACPLAHSAEELREWQIRRAGQIQQQQRAVMEKKRSAFPHIQWIKDTINESRRLGLPQHAMITEVSGQHSVLCKQNLFVTHLDKNKEITWEFKISAKASNGFIYGLQSVFFLEDNSREFSITGLSLHHDRRFHQLDRDLKEIALQNFSEIPPNLATVVVKFYSAFYGNFNVTVVFDFGFAPRIVRFLGVVVAPEKHLIRKLSLRPTEDCAQDNELSWLDKYQLVPFDGNSDEKQRTAQSTYALPSNLHYGVKYGAFEHLDVELTRENYRDRLHTLLYVEEYERRKRMSRLNVHCEDVFTLFHNASRPRSLRIFDAKKTLFIPVDEETLEEVGILISLGSKALMRLRQFVYGAPDSQDDVLHEALVVKILSDEIVLEINSKTLSLLNSMTAPVPVDICFRFVDTFLCMHSAIDRVNLDRVFYSGTSEIICPTPTLSHSVLSPAQASALSRLFNSPPGAPILLLGPFGTGKTQTLAEAVKVLITKKNAKPSMNCRILICTHSNSAADHYIENYLHPFFDKLQKENASIEKPLRVYWEHRLAMTISDKILPYCIMDLNSGTFRNPTLQELEQKTIIVTTLVTTDILIKCGAKPGFFTHIFIDEAAQAMELETLVPISLATEETKVVLAGDHLQLSPPVFSTIGRKLQLGKSLLVRLYESFPVNSPRKLLLLENYRSYEEIVNIPSKLFYEGSLIAKNKTPNGLSYPIQFYGVQGLEEKAYDSPSYANMAEVAEISERVDELVKTWPKKHWGEMKLEKTCVLCAHHCQIRQIRRELRGNGFRDVRVENVNNVQGLEFDVLLLSTVRTSRMLGPGHHEGKDLGLLSNPKLLNTAITRAKFSLIIVGDPKALCSVGDCRVCWKTILSLCSENGTFHHRVPLREVLSSVREYQTQAVPPMVPNNLRTMSPATHGPINPNMCLPTIDHYALRSGPVLSPHQPMNIRPLARFENGNLLAPPHISHTASHTGFSPLPVGPKPSPSPVPPINSPSSPRPVYCGPPSDIRFPTVRMSCPRNEGKHMPSNHDNVQSTVPQNDLLSTSGVNVVGTLERNIQTTLKIVLENEEVVKACIKQPPKIASLNVRENLERQLTLIRSQRSQLEEQQLLNKDLEKTVHQWQHTWESSGVAKSKNRLEIIDYSGSSLPSSSFTHVERVDLNHDREVSEWYNLRRQDPIVQDYVKSFETLSKRVRNATSEFSETPMTEACDIFGPFENGSGESLRGWVLQPDCVMYASSTSLHDEHLTKEEALEKIENGELVSCSLAVDRVSGGQSAIGEIDDPSESNVYIPDRKAMNRALNTDYVAVMITGDIVQGKKLRHGKVVAILQERHRRQVVCRLSSSESNSMIPLNNTNPKFAILQSENHVGRTGVAVFGIEGSTIKFQRFISDVKGKLFLVQFLQWDANYQWPLGFAVKCFNECTSPTNTLSVLCADSGIQKDFPTTVIEQVNLSFPDNWEIPDEERRSRRRYDDVFTIDVEGTEEVDDGVTVRPVSYGIYCVTIHVADVSYFVMKDSALDRAAQRRGSSIYLPNSFNDSIPLLPKKLSHDLCSLIPGKERLAISAEFFIDSSGKLLQTPMFRRSIVVSQQQLSYDEVDTFLAEESKRTTNSRISEQLLKSIQILHCLSQELWSRRVRGRSFQASTKASGKSPSRTIIEELMILTNTAVAEKLTQYSKTRPVPFRLHRSPKYHALQDLATWVSEERLNIEEMFATKWLSGFQVRDREMSNPPPVCVNLQTWRDICQAIKIDNMVDLTKAILNVNEDSPVLSVVARVERLLPKGKYISSSQYSSTERRHFALNTDCYTHFTSPIRRYFDIVVHRVLLSAEKSLTVYKDDEMEELCNNQNLTRERVNIFSKQCTTVSKADLLREASPWRSMEVETPGFDYLTIRNSEDDLISSVVKLHAQDMGVSLKEWNDDVQELLAHWTFNDIDVQYGADIATDDMNHDREGPSTHADQKKPFLSVSKTVVEVPADLWCQLLDASADESTKRLLACQERVNESAVVTINSGECCDGDDGVSIIVDHFGLTTVTRFFRRGDKLRGLFNSSSFSGLAQPFLQAVEVAPGKVCCVQHHQRPVENFTQMAKLRMREKYSSVDQYLSIHLPLLTMESAKQSVRACVSPIQLRNVAMEWTINPLNVIRGAFSIPTELLLPSTRIHKDDFVCVRTSAAVFHGQVHDVSSPNSDKKELLVKILSASQSEVPDGGLCTVEIIPQALSYRRMISSVRSLVNATEDIRSLVLKRDCCTSTHLKRKRNPSASSFVLGSSQKEAFNKAIKSRLTLIEGLPGTGKTYTAAAIAEHFFLENSRQKSSGNVLFCCPTDQALDVAASMLSRFAPELRVLRVYSRDREVQAFPEIGAIYDVVNVSGTRDNRVDINTSSQQAVLHFSIRSDANPFKEKIEKCAQRIKILKESGRKRQQLCRILEEYRQLVKMAEEYELSQKSGKIILCTCIEVGSSRLRNHGNIKQCIIDESNMCSEAESLVVLQSVITSCDRIVLVGDRKQLAPSVQNKTARKFGLGRSLFQSLLTGRERKRFSSHVLDTQYRMNASIQQFSFNSFYNGQSCRDADILTMRPDSGHFDSFWCRGTCRVMAYHVCGEEKCSQELPGGYLKERSLCNEGEARKVIEVVDTLSERGVALVQISILTPYSGQEALIKYHLRKREMKDIEVVSFVGAQGSENDFIIISTVRSLDQSEIIPSPPPDWLDMYLGVLVDERQTNVALSRARHGLIVIGNQDLLSVCPGWSHFVALCKKMTT